MSRKPAPPVADRHHLFPPGYIQALRECQHWPAAQRIERIDWITDELAQAGYVRRRSDQGRFYEWEAGKATLRELGSIRARGMAA